MSECIWEYDGSSRNKRQKNKFSSPAAESILKNTFTEIHCGCMHQTVKGFRWCLLSRIWQRRIIKQNTSQIHPHIPTNTTISTCTHTHTHIYIYMAMQMTNQYMKIYLTSPAVKKKKAIMRYLFKTILSAKCQQNFKRLILSWH